MAQPALEWQAGTVTAIRSETRQTKSFTLALPKWMSHRPGMHYDVRLTAPDGYQTERSSSIDPTCTTWSTGGARTAASTGPSRWGSATPPRSA